MKTRLIEYGKDGGIRLVERDIPEPGPGEVQVEGGICGICSWDIAMVKGKGAFPVPAPPGHEAVGYVRRIGPGVTGFREGDRVTGGGFAALRNIPAAGAYKLPESDLPIEYWVVEPVSCIVTGLDHCRLRAGDRVVVVGCGFMGLLLIQGLKHSYAGAVIGIDVVESRLELARRLGVEETYNLGAGAETGVDRDELAARLKSREIDVVVDTSGAQAGLDLSTDICRRGGIINLFGWMKGATATFDPSKWHGGGFTVVNSSPGSKIRDTFPPAIDLIHNGVIDPRPLVTHVAPMEGYADLMDGVIAGDESYVKGVVRLDG
jgi:threonine dehydrogenase-like Zn-dependent dehydrogenase